MYIGIIIVIAALIQLASSFFANKRSHRTYLDSDDESPFERQRSDTFYYKDSVYIVGTYVDSVYADKKNK